MILWVTLRLGAAGVWCVGCLMRNHRSAIVSFFDSGPAEARHSVGGPTRAEKGSMTSLRTELEFAVQVAEEAGKLTLEYFQRSGVKTERKSDDSPVTVADYEAERLIRSRIASQFPNDGILGEEEGEVPGTSGRRWTIDPIDGTKSFVQGVPLYGVRIGLEAAGEALVGVVGIPGVGDMVAAARGEGCFWNGHQRAYPPWIDSMSRFWFTRAVTISTVAETTDPAR